MIVSYDLTVVLGCAAAGIICASARRAAKNFLTPRQLSYFCDLFMAGAWMLLAIWLGTPQARFVVGVSFLAGAVGLAERFWPDRPMWLGYVCIGLLSAFFGPSINLISFIDGKYIYPTPFMSVVITTLWFTVFPVVLQQLDGIFGLAGHILAVAFSLMLISVALASHEMADAFFISFAGLVLLGVFWRRFSDVYGQAGKALSSMWGTLVAGTAILGVSKGIVFSSMLYLSLGLFAIPLAEASLYLVNWALADTPHGPERLYRSLIRRGLSHPDAVRLIAALCAFLGSATALSQYRVSYAAWVWGGIMGLIALAVLTPLAVKFGGKPPLPGAKPCLWGVTIDNMSINYALARARGLILSPRGPSLHDPKDAPRPNLVATVNALGMDEAVRDPDYHRVLRHSAMVLSDGVGLLWGLRFLGMPIQERVTGIDFAEQLCRMAAAEGWPVYFLGAKGDTALACSRVMAARYPGLTVAGARDGYFAMNDPAPAEAVAASGAKILFAAMGIPRQEKWVALHGERLGSVLAVGVGGAFDVLSGQLRRAPSAMQRMGMEWLFRLCQEPFRWRKDMYLIAFVLRVLATRVGLYSWKEEK